MNILILNLAFFPRIGGVENSIRSICELYSARGDAVVAVAADVVDATGVRYPDNQMQFGARVRRFRKGPMGTYYLYCYMLLRKLRRAERFDLVISRSHVTTLLGYMAGFREINYVVPGIVKNQQIVTFNGLKSFYVILKKKINELIQKLSFSVAERVFVFSETMAIQVRQICASANIIKTFPGCDVVRFNYSSEKRETLRRFYNISPSEKIVLCVGRLSPEKGFDHAIRAISRLPENYKLWIVGSGPYESHLRVVAAAVNSVDRVHFVRQTTEPEQYYKIADVFLFTSSYEPFGQVLLEAAFSELPIVAFDPQRMGGVNTATREIFVGFDGLVHFVDQHSNLPLAIMHVNKGNINSLICQNFKEKYTWLQLVRYLDMSTDRFGDDH